MDYEPERVYVFNNVDDDLGKQRYLYYFISGRACQCQSVLSRSGANRWGGGDHRFFQNCISRNFSDDVLPFDNETDRFVTSHG